MGPQANSTSSYKNAGYTSKSTKMSTTQMIKKSPSTASDSTEVPFTFHAPAIHTLPMPPYYRTIGQAEIRALPPITQQIVNQEIAQTRISNRRLDDVLHPTYDCPEGVDAAEYAEGRKRAEEFFMELRGRNIDPAEEVQPGGPRRPTRRNRPQTQEQQEHKSGKSPENSK
jgi:hypothetical protein